ncbi:MAG: aspartate aminotransferase family protein [Defluviicoccus sp.]|nr:aspartate aminotransferase family protein [Defluviicoccus sp.]MDE0383123.1 aspartate aminotransferase family protein [Defluviicoccus sp.]
MIPAVMPSYARVDIAFERGEGPYLYASDGRRFLDFGAGIAVTVAGHCHPHLVEALTGQAQRLWHTSNLYQIPGQTRLAERLTAASFADTVFFCNSGAEAMEASLKTARKYQFESGRAERYRFVVFEDSFHGRTLALIAAGANDAHRRGFGPMLDSFDRVAYGDLDAVKAAIGPETAGIVVEPVQGEGGIRPADPGFLRGLRGLADEHGLALIYDEVQCGIGRTGHLFAHEAADAPPDIMALAKGLGGGFPIGACLVDEEAAIGMVPGTHGSTFGGNPLASAAANAVLDIVLEDGFLEGVRQRGAALGDALRGLARRYQGVIEEVRGVGFMWGMKCVGPNAELGGKMFDRGLLNVLAADNMVRLLPPLIAGEDHIAEALETVEACCAEIAK